MTTQKRARGRPAGGTAPGERVTDYPRLTVRLPPATKARLETWSLVTKRPAWRLLADAVDRAVRDLPRADRELVEKTAQRRRDAT